MSQLELFPEEAAGTKPASSDGCCKWESVASGELPGVQVIKDMRARFRLGMERYGKPCKPFDGEDYLQHLYEELMDACVYIRTVMMERDSKLERK